MPDLYPTSVKVHDAGAPLDGIGVELYKVGTSTPYSLGGTTDSTGTANLSTTHVQYTGNGIPVGSYRVVLRQRIEVPSELQEDETMELSSAEQQDLARKREKYLDDNRRFSRKLSDFAATPLEIEVSSSGFELDVDVSQYK